MKAIAGMGAGESALRGHRDHNCFTEYDRIMSTKTGRGRAIAPSCIEIADQIVLRHCITSPRCNHSLTFVVLRSNEKIIPVMLESNITLNQHT